MLHFVACSSCRFSCLSFFFYHCLMDILLFQVKFSKFGIEKKKKKFYIIHLFLLFWSRIKHKNIQILFCKIKHNEEDIPATTAYMLMGGIVKTCLKTCYKSFAFLLFPPIHPLPLLPSLLPPPITPSLWSPPGRAPWTTVGGWEGVSGAARGSGLWPACSPGTHPTSIIQTPWAPVCHRLQHYIHLPSLSLSACCPQEPQLSSVPPAHMNHLILLHY